MTFDRGSRGHRRADEVRAPARALTALEVAVRRGRAALARLEPVRIHRETHRATGLAPLEAGFEEYLVEPFTFSLRFHEPRAGHDHRQPDVRCHAAPELLHDVRGRADVFDTRVRARADEHLVDFDR